MDAPKVLFYGNCQLGSLAQTLQLSSTMWYVPCFEDGLINEGDFMSIVRNADIIITQPISDDYKGKSYLSTKHIIQTCKRTAKIFIFPSLHFEFYYPDLTYKFIDNVLLQEPADYHYKCILENFDKGVDFILEKFIENINYKSSDELLSIAEKSILELKRREQLALEYRAINSSVYVIFFSEYLEANFKQKLLFYSMNHPTACSLQFVAERIRNELGFGAINYTHDGLRSSERGILFSCLQKCVNFDIKVHSPRLSKYELESNREIIKKYIDSYISTIIEPHKYTT